MKFEAIQTDETTKTFCLPNDIVRFCNMMTNGDFPIKDRDDIYYKEIEVGEQYEDELNGAINKILSLAAENLPQELQPTLNDIVLEFNDIFRTKLSAGPFVDLLPMFTELYQGERPVKAR